jgi:protein-S-isoprenylcysteine O-methyltransferase Ste14
MDRLLSWLPLVTIVAVMTAAKLRAAGLRRRGLRVVVVDWHRPWPDVLSDSLLIVVFFFWFYLLLAEACSFSLAWLPTWLTTKIVAALPAKIVGAALVIVAPLLYAAAIIAMDASWRLGIDRKRPGPLITTGPFAWSRNPIYVAFDSIMLGAFLIHGRTIFLLSGAAVIALVHVVILREERFLTEHFGDDFRNYRTRVGRYSPWF